MRKRRVSEIAQLRKEEQVKRIICLLESSKAGLTSLEITMQTGVSFPRKILSDLKKRGIIVQKKGITKGGNVSYHYVLSTDRSGTKDSWLAQRSTPAEEREREKQLPQ